MNKKKTKKSNKENKEKETEKVYITRDERDNTIYVWRKPPSGVWSPQKMPNCDMVNWQRPDRNVEYMDIYEVSNFKKKFGISIPQKVKKCVHLDKKLLEDKSFMIREPLERIKKYGKK